MRHEGSSFEKRHPFYNKVTGSLQSNFDKKTIEALTKATTSSVEIRHTMITALKAVDIVTLNYLSVLMSLQNVIYYQSLPIVILMSYDTHTLLS